MVGLHLVAAALALLGAVALGVVVHEALHLAVLRAAGVRCELQLDGSGGHLAGFGGALAAVRLRSVPAAPLTLRVASLAPLALLLPVLSIPAGVVPDPFATGNVVAQGAVVGWFACALPSPADFSIAFHAEDLVGGPRDAPSSEGSGAGSSDDRDVRSAERGAG